MLRFTLISMLLAISTAVDLPKDQARIQAENDIKKYLDKSVSPCDNFFKFACGNWKNYHELPDNKLDATGFSTLSDNIQKELKEMLEDSQTIYNADVEVKIRDFYKSCINTDLIKTKNNEPIIKFVKSLGDIPMINKEWDETKFDYVDVTEKLEAYGFDGLFGFKVLNNKDKLYVGEIDLPYNKEAYDNQQVMDDYLGKIVEFIHTTFNLGHDEAMTIGKEILDFEKELSKLLADNALKADEKKYFVPTTVEELNKKYPKIQWDKLMAQAIGKPVELKQVVVEYNTNYLPAIMELIEKTPKKIIANYMVWHGLSEFLLITKPPLNGDKDDIWNFCVSKTKEYYPKEIAVMYSRKYYDTEVQKDIEDMFDAIKKTVHKKFEQLDWIDEATKKLAFERLDNAKIEIVGYSKDVDVPVASDFSTIVSNPDEYYENVFNKLKYNIQKYRSKILSDESIENYVKDPASLLARYDVEENVLKISLGFLNPPFYTKTLPRNMKFAQLGAIIVHELLHGFDAIGQTVPVGNVPVPWWSESSLNVFNDKSKCFAEQYTKQGSTTPLNDNVADNGGLKYAYEAYKDWLETVKDTMKEVFDEEVFPDVEYTNTQLFFLTHAQTWCHYSKPSPTSSEFFYPSEYRINIPMTNCDCFAKEFECAESTPMNPPNKCVLW